MNCAAPIGTARPGRIAWGVIALVVLVLPGCGRLFKASCARPDDYSGAIQNAPLKVPAGLDAPDTRIALPIPPLAEPERPRTATDPCLDAPPKYIEAKEPTPAA